MAEHGNDKQPLSCPLCKGRNPAQFYHENGYKYWRCGSCRLLFLWPQPTADHLHDHYQEYLPVASEQVEEWGWEMKPVIDSAASFLDRNMAEKGKLLDIGCGYGFFLQAMQERGWQVEGVELSKPAADIARDKTGAVIHSCGVEDMEVADGYDVVTMFYVIEHVGDPVAILRSIRKILKPGGILVLRYPNTSPLLWLSSAWSRRLGLMQAPSHLFDYAGSSMSLLLKEAGFGSYHTTIDANTRSSHLAKRFISCYIGFFAAFLARLSGNLLLVPGFSRITYASPDTDRFDKKTI